MRDFISNCFVIDLDGEIKRQTIHLRKNYMIKIPDAIIAASSIVKKIPLFTALGLSLSFVCVLGEVYQVSQITF